MFILNHIDIFNRLQVCAMINNKRMIFIINNQQSIKDSGVN